jgi:carboxyl-terminal processing protease
VEGMMLDEAVDKIRGQAGTDVRITVMRTVDGASTVQSFPITRAVIRHKAVHVRDLGDGITHIKLDSFMSETVAEQVKAALEEAVKGKGIIFDLRGNPGGELGNAIDVASFFLPDGTLLVQRERTPAGMVEVHTSVNSKWKTVITTNPRDAENLDIKVHPRAPLVVPTDMPVILLIDGGSASASDIFAGVMKAHRRMIVIGDTSFGKDVGQAVIPLLYGRAMKVTAFDFLPAGESMNGVGILPHVVADSENAEDEAVKRIKPLIAAAEAMKERQQKLEENRRAR